MQGPPHVRPDVRLRLALDAARLGTWYWDAASGVTVWDRQMRRIFGVGPEWPGTYDAYVARLHPLDRADVLAVLARAVDSGERYEVRHRILHGDGSVRWIEGVGHVVRDTDGVVTGTIGCARDVTERVEQEELLTRSFVTQAELAEQARRGAERVEHLQQVTARLATALTVDEVSALVGDHLADAVGATRTGLAVPTPDGRSLRLVAATGYAEELVDALRVQPLDEALPMGAAAVRAEPLFLRPADIRRDFPALVPYHERGGSRSLAALPLLAGGEVLGVLSLGFEHEQPFDDEQRTYLLAVTAQAAQAVSRSLLVARLREVTAELQAGLGPGDLPRVDGLELAVDYRTGGHEVEAIGGDWFDVVPLGDGTVAVVVGDVMGRGVRAATTMTRLRASVRAFLSDDPDPAALAGRLDRLVVRENLQDFVTLLVARLDPAGGRLTVVNAGHVQPVVVTPDGSGDPARATARVLPVPPGPPVGLASEPRTATHAALAPGATLLLFTDGLVERAGEDIDRGIDLVVEVAGRTDRPAAALVTEVVAALGLPPGGDDVTVLAVRRTTADLRELPPVPRGPRGTAERVPGTPPPPSP